jgi:PIN domain nuclease of toxin-antitoxin system
VTLLFDTHVWVWWNAVPEKIPESIRDAVGESDGPIHLSAISVWEVAKFVEKGRLTLGIDVDSWVARSLEVPGFRLEPLSPAIAIAGTRLPGTFHNDPADQIIAATARDVGSTLVTADHRLLDYPYVQTLWA